MSLIPVEAGDNPLNPRFCICLRCGEDTTELAIGAIRKAQTSQGWVYAMRGAGHKVKKQLAEQGIHESLHWEALGADEKVPSSAPCEKCKEDIINQREVVEAGGVYFKCLKCGLEGTISCKSDLARDVRKNTNIQAPNPVGVESEGCGEVNRVDLNSKCLLRQETG